MKKKKQNNWRLFYIGEYVYVDFLYMENIDLWGSRHINYCRIFFIFILF